MSDDIESLLGRLRSRGVDPPVVQRIEASVRVALARPATSNGSFWRYAAAVAFAVVLAVATVVEDRSWRERLAQPPENTVVANGSDDQAILARMQVAWSSRSGSPWNRLLYQL